MPRSPLAVRSFHPAPRGAAPHLPGGDIEQFAPTVLDRSAAPAAPAALAGG
jgi:hypothetical protein